MRESFQGVQRPLKGRTSSVPLRFADQVDQVVEMRGCTATLRVWAEGGFVAEHVRPRRARIVPHPTHYEGVSNQRIAAPVRMDCMGHRLAEILVLAPAQRPIDFCAELVGLAR